MITDNDAEPDLHISRWPRRELALLAVLIVALGAVFYVQGEMRRQGMAHPVAADSIRVTPR